MIHREQGSFRGPMTEEFDQPCTIAEIVHAHRSGRSTPEATVVRCFARIRAHGDPAIFICLRDEADALAEAKSLASTGDSNGTLWGVPVAIKDNIDVKGLPTTAACPAFAYEPSCRRNGRCAAAAGRRYRHRQNQSRPVRDRARRRALALWRAAQSVRSEAHSGRIELGLGGCGRGRPGSAGARHRHGGLRPRAGGAQQYRRPQAEPRSRLDRGRRAGLPHARLRVGVRAHRR